MAVGEKSYIRGRAKRWFWISAAMLMIMMLWSAISSELYPALLERVVIPDQTAFLMAGVLTFLYTAAWVLITAVYGLRSKVKGFKIMFLILGGLYILNAYGHYLSNYYVSYIMSFRGLIHDTMVRIAMVLTLALRAAWIAFAVMMIVHRRTGGVLRGMAILLLFAQAAELMYGYYAGTLYQWLGLRYDAQVVTSLTWFLEFVMTLAAHVPVILLLGAMSFSRMKADREKSEGTDFPQV